MKNYVVALAMTILFAALALAQECPPNTDSLAELKQTVHTIVKEGVIEGHDIKRFRRSGDMTAVAILQTLSDSEMARTNTARQVFWILREAFNCPSTCITDKSERTPRITLLLLDHLQDGSSDTRRSEIDETRRYVMEQTSKLE